MASSSENQGLQIAVIIFALLTIVMSGATFYVFKLSEDAELRAADAEQKAQKALASIRAAETDIEELKQMIGHAPSVSMDAVKAQFDKDKLAYAGTFPPDKQTYAAALAEMYQVLDTANKERVAERTELEQLKQRLAAIERDRASTLAAHKQEADKAREELMNRIAAFDALQKQLADDKAKLADEAKKLRDEIARLQTEAADKEKKYQDQLLALQNLNEGKQKVIDELTQETFEVADGEIRWVSPETRTVWINLGRADSLKPQVSFSVFGADANGVARSTPKGKIEVTEILGDHLAEARVLEDSHTDPILTGDKLYTPLWHRGRQERFALAGFIDLDKDGTSDVAMIRNLIAANGGVIDAELLPDGTVQGEMTIHTNYLIRGSAPEGKADEFGKMQGDAVKLGVKMLPVEQFLDYVGWKDTSRVVQFGKNADPRDFRQRVPANPLDRTAPRTDAGLFRKREAPRSNGTSAY